MVEPAYQLIRIVATIRPDVNPRVPQMRKQMADKNGYAAERWRQWAKQDGRSTHKRRFRSAFPQDQNEPVRLV